jgi:hypothetical protein
MSITKLKEIWKATRPAAVLLAVFVLALAAVPAYAKGLAKAVNDATLESFGAQTVTNTVAATDITEAAITITAPVTGATPVTTATTSGTGYTCSAVTWTPTVTGGKFLGSTGYTASVTLTAASGY